MTTAQNILKTLGYFDLFQYPLTRQEIYSFHTDDVEHATIDIALQELLKDEYVFKLDEFYSLHNDQQLAERRRKGNSMAADQLKTAGRVAKFLSRFPYVKAIAVSGSLSKNFATEKTDIDFFVVTASNRLWIARTCMHLYKKLTFLTGRQNWFCMNYYVDEEGLEIKEKNIFTAIEVATLLPMQGGSCIAEFVASNTWVKDFLPVHDTGKTAVPEIQKGLFAKLVEGLFNGRLGNYADKLLMHITQKRWQKKVLKQRLNSRGGYLGMVVDRHFSKPDPKNFQDKVVEGYRHKVEQLLQHKNTTLYMIA